MSDEFKKSSQSIADSSGFPLQIRIADITNSSSDWKVYVEEYPWRSELTHSEGFIDLVIHRKESFSAMVIECKRVRDTAWVFLIPEKKPNERSDARLWLSNYVPLKWDRFDWSNDYPASPSSYESRFCAIPGQVHGRLTILERTVSDLIEAVEALALQEKKIVSSDPNVERPFGRVYIPVIITTAELRVSFFEPSSISLSDGSLPADTEFKIIPYIRFRKSLTRQVNSSRHKSLKDAYKASERTVFIVNAESWDGFLNKWSI